MMKRVSGTLAATLLLAAATAQADPAAVAPPKGAKLLLSGSADGVQIYGCVAKDQGFAWVLTAPDAAVFDGEGRQIMTHFAGPSWKTPDGTVVVGEIMAKADAPTPNTVPWVLLRAKSHEGTGLLSQTAFIRRIDTKGGTAPAAGCDAGHVGQEVRIRYSAVYEFYAAGE
jgi:hypothetical protein